MLIHSLIFGLNLANGNQHSILADVFSRSGESARQNQRCMMKFRLQAAARSPQGTNSCNRFAIRQPLQMNCCQLWRRKLGINELGFQCSACLLSKNNAVNAGQPRISVCK